MTKRRMAFLLFALALVLAAVSLGLRDQPASPPATEADALATPAQADAALAPPAAQTAARASAPIAAPLPPPDTPVALLADALKPRADAGDSRAACRLAVELLRCRLLRQQSEMTVPDSEPADARMARQGHLEFADRLAEMAIRKIQLQQNCDAVDPALLRRAPHYLAMAAHAGEPEAMLRYAVGEQHGFLGQGFTADPDFDHWRRDSPAMLLRAARAGRTEAVHLLRLAYGSDATPFAGLIDDDPVQAYAWGIVRSKLSGGPRAAPDTLDAAAMAEAEALAADWYKRHFENASARTGSPALFLPALGDPIQPAGEERFCE